MQPPSDASPPGAFHVQSRLEWWCKPSRHHTSEDLAELSKLTEVVKRYMQNRGESLIRELGERPLLISGSGDGTPIKNTEQFRLQSQDCTVKRSGKASFEFYVQQAFVCGFDDSGRLEAHVLMEEPRRMTCGKSAWADLALVLQLWPRPRELGHVGLEVLHMAWDRAKCEAVARLWKQWLAVTQRSHSGLPSAWLYLLTWPITTPCSIHDTHNSLKWSLYLRMVPG